MADTWREKLSNVNVVMQIGHFMHCSSKDKSATYPFFCFNVYLSSSRTVLVFEKNCDQFLQNKGFYARGKSKKVRFP